MHMSDSLARLYEAVLAASNADPAKSRTAKLLSAGRGKVAKKLAEEAAGKPEAVVRESADLLYNLVVLWAHAGVHPDQVWAEMRRRELMFGIAEKLPKRMVQGAPLRKIVAIESGRVRKRR